jgi:hypothetical protein
MAQRRKIPIGAGSFFVLTQKTARFPIESHNRKLVAELLVNADGNGAIALVPPGCRIPDGTTAVRMSPIEAVEMLRRVNLYRLSAGHEQLDIPAALVRRAKADTAPGIEALVPFPGKLKTFYEGRGSWAGTGLWVSADGEQELEMSAAVGFLRKRLTSKEAELWLRANGHEVACLTIGKPPPEHEHPDQWRVATKGHESAGKRDLWAISWPQAYGVDATPTAAPTAEKDRELREAIKRARTLPPPSISPPRKPRKPRRGR